MPPKLRLAAVPDASGDIPPAPLPAPPDLRESVREALAAMTWLDAADEVLKTLCMRHAEEIEQAAARAQEYHDLYDQLGDDMPTRKRLQRLEAMCDLTKTVGWLGPQLQGFIRDLGGTPAARAALKTDKPIGARLDRIRKAAGQS